MTESVSFVEYCQNHELDRLSLQAACVDLVKQQTRVATLDGLYQNLLARVDDSDAVDRLLYQFEGFPEYADVAATVLLLAAWNDPKRQEDLKTLMRAAMQRSTHIDAHELALAIIAGLAALLAEGPLELTEIPYRDETGVWQTLIVEEGIPVVDLLWAVRDVFEG